MTDDQAERIRDTQVDAVATACAKLLEKLGPAGFTPEAIFEGTVRGGLVQLIAGTGCTAADAAELLRDMASGLENLRRPDLHVVQ